MKTEGVIKFFTVLFGMEAKEPPISDSTLYEIKTQTHFYVGKIVVQDDKMMKVWLVKQMKAVKVLKENIVRVKIMERADTSIQFGKAQGWKTLANPVYSHS